MERFLDETKLKMLEAQNSIEERHPEKQTLESIAPPTPWPGAILDAALFENLGIKQIHVVESNDYVGEGSYGRVLKMTDRDNSCLFAVKRPFHCNLRSKNRIEREAEVWSNLDHKNILPLEGYAILSSCSLPALVSPLCVANLVDFLTEPRNLSEKERFKFLEDVINGLTHLHEHNYAHGDLRGVNVLVREEKDQGYYAVLADFGVSNATDGRSQKRTTIGQRTNEAWLSPELMEKQLRDGDVTRVSQKGDIWAFGCVMLEVQYGAIPYENSSSPCNDLLQNRTFPARKEDLEGLRESHWELMCRCWAFDEDERINIEPLSVRVTELLKELP